MRGVLYCYFILFMALGAICPGIPEPTKSQWLTHVVWYNR